MDPLVISALVAGISAVAGLFGVIQARKKIDVEVDSVIVASAEKSVSLGMQQLAYFEKENVRLRGRLSEEQERNKTLDDLIIEIKALKLEVLALKTELASRPTKDELRAEIRALTEQLLGLGQTPKPDG